MKISGEAEAPAIFSFKATNRLPDSDLQEKQTSKKPPRRKVKNAVFSGAGGVKRDKAQGGKKSGGPATPLLKWKFNDGDFKVADEELPGKGRRKARRENEATVSARKLAAVLWRFQSPPEIPAEAAASGSPSLRRNEKLGFQSHVSHVGLPFLCHHNNRAFVPDLKDLPQSPLSVSGPKNGHRREVYLDVGYVKFRSSGSEYEADCTCACGWLEPSFQPLNSIMEGATKWDPACAKASDDVHQVFEHMKLLDQQISAVSAVSALEVELEQARSHIYELETERQSSKKKLEHFWRKLNEEKALWRSKEHEKVRAIIDDIKADLSREKKNRQRMEIVNSKLVNELANAKKLAKRYMQDYEKERKARELIEEVCDELAKEIGEHQAEVEAMKRESAKFREEVDEERKMLQMAEVWREERVQMKLVDAKVALEEKYSQLNKLVADLDTFLRARSGVSDVKVLREAELFRQAAASVNIHNIKEFSYEPPKSDDIFAVFEEMNFGETTEREIGPCVAYSPASHASKIHTVSPEIIVYNKGSIQRAANASFNQNGEIEEDGSGWETVSHSEDQGSNCSGEASEPSVNKLHGDSNVSGSGTEWEENVVEETPITEISEICSVPSRQLKKASSISRLWRSCPTNGENYKIISVEEINGRLSNGRISNGSLMSPDQGSAKGGLSPPDMVGQWSSPDSGNPHIARGMKGCIEWPRGPQKNSLKAKLLEARMGSQKIQLRHVLKQKI
ncbi:hypothetical protein RJ641_034609 [Dillenia turbinata]|uniref:Uncharacterized protein n=1 Tax=Dillenia turbinata TaxID=194707 RepID=A0AAN8ZBP7_9MAGN